MSRSPIEQIERVRNLLAFVLVVAFISAVPLFVYKTIPEGNNDIIVYMVGQLSGMATTALGFYFVNKVGQDALDATRAENTGKMAEAVSVALKVGTVGTDGTGPEIIATPDAAAGAQSTADAAQKQADKIEEATP